MAVKKLKVGDTGPKLTYQLFDGGTARDLSAGTTLILVSCETDNDATNQYIERDVTTLAKANGDPANGKVGLPIFDGRTGPGASDSQAVTDKTVDGKITVTLAAAGGSVVTQEIYMTTAGGATYYRVWTGDDGDAALGVTVNISDADLILEPTMHTDDRSATNGSAALTTPPTPSAALAGAGAGDIANGTHLFVAVNKRAADTDTAGLYRLEIIVVDNADGGSETTYPEDGWEYLEVTDDID